MPRLRSKDLSLHEPVAYRQSDSSQKVEGGYYNSCNRMKLT